MPQRIEFEGVVHEFPDDFTDADISAALGETAPAQASTTSSTNVGGFGAALGAGMALAPKAVAVVNRAAGVAGKVAAARAAGMVPAVVAVDAAGDLLRGDRKAAAVKAGGAVATSQVPRVLRAVQAATAPARTVAGGASTLLQASGVPYSLPSMTTAGGAVSRLASAMSRFAGPVGLAVETMFGDGAAGHRPDGETAATTADRQASFAQQFKEQVNREAGREVITGETTEQIIESIARYRAGR